MVKSINRYLGPEDVIASEQDKSAEPLHFISSRPLGGAWFLDQLWEETWQPMSRYLKGDI